VILRRPSVDSSTPNSVGGLSNLPHTVSHWMFVSCAGQRNFFFAFSLRTVTSLARDFALRLDAVRVRTPRSPRERAQRTRVCGGRDNVGSCASGSHRASRRGTSHRLRALRLRWFRGSARCTADTSAACLDRDAFTRDIEEDPGRAHKPCARVSRERRDEVDSASFRGSRSCYESQPRKRATGKRVDYSQGSGRGGAGEAYGRCEGDGSARGPGRATSLWMQDVHGRRGECDSSERSSGRCPGRALIAPKRRARASRSVRAMSCTGAPRVKWCAPL